MAIWQVILIFGIITVAFDGIWATIAQRTGYAYSKGIWGSFLLYAIAGGMAFQNSDFLTGMLAGGGVAGVDATIGWWVSWIIGPGRLPDTIAKEARPNAIIKAIIRVIMMGAIFGFLGALVKLIF